jgi:predicted dehydrogenase
MKHIQNLAGAVLMGSLLMACSPEEKKAEENTENTATANANMVKIITLDPGHFHAALVQKTMYDNVDSTVYVYAPEGSDVQDHLKRIDGYNNRQENPTRWKEDVYTGPDFLQKMAEQKKGNVVVISGNNQKKTEYIKKSVDAGLHVLADKPMCIDTEGFELLKASFESAGKNNVLLYDIMTERSEITTMLQMELSQIPEIFGELQKGTVKDPAVTKESVHHFYKYVSGSPLKRPAWFMDVAQQGEGVVDVTTHLVDLVQWECFPEQVIDYQKDIEIVQARRWTTPMTRSQFTLITGQPDFPEYLRKDVVNDTTLNIYSNGEINYKLKGIHAKVSVIWNYKAPEGAGDTHYSIMKGSKANLVIRQGAEQKYVPELYIEPAPKTKLDESAIAQAFGKIQSKYAGVELKKAGADKWQIVIPDKYRTGHEAHFGEVTERFLQYLEAGKLPDWEVPNMLAKYYTTTQALSKAKASSNLSSK